MEKLNSLQLDDGSQIAVMGGGPAGSFFSYFLLDMAERVGIDVQVDIYEPKDFSRPGPPGCNMCGGIVHESMVQILATEGISLPPTVVQRGIDSHVLHMGVGSVRIETPLHEKRIGAMYRGAGPRGIKERKWGSLGGSHGYCARFGPGQGPHHRQEEFSPQNPKTLRWLTALCKPCSAGSGS